MEALRDGRIAGVGLLVGRNMDRGDAAKVHLPAASWPEPHGLVVHVAHPSTTARMLAKKMRPPWWRHVTGCGGLRPPVHVKGFSTAPEGLASMLFMQS